MSRFEFSSVWPVRRLPPLRLAWYVCATLLAVFTYFYGLDSQHIPKNGDEYPYEHITRLTAANGHLLPLQSDMFEMRNTKPPLLFWQGILSTDWAQSWTLWDLRYPSVIYTLLTAGLVFLLGWKLSGKRETAFVAMLAYLGFFNIYRFGRPFLTNAPEIFWLFLPFFSLLYWRDRAFALNWSGRVVFPLLLGVSIGIGLLYKSFALAAPVCTAIAWWYLHVRNYRIGLFLREDAYKLVVMTVVALGVFGLWFALDPDPAAVWQEFVVAENAGKFDPHGDSYLKKMWWGSSSVWSLAMGYLSNAGVLAFPFAGLVWLGIKAIRARLRKDEAARHSFSDQEKLLWIWVVLLFAVFSLPSQRSNRYLLDAMPAVAVLMALSWERIRRGFFLLGLLASGVMLAVYAYFSLRLQQEVSGAGELGVPLLANGSPFGGIYVPFYWWFLAFACWTTLLGLFYERMARPAILVVALFVSLGFAAFLRPFDGARGQFSPAALEAVQAKDVWVPCNFRGKDEGYRFIVPGAQVHGYDTQVQSEQLAHLAATYPRFTVRLPLVQTEIAGADCPDCQVLGQRLDIRDRHSNAELKAMFLEGRVFENLFVREWLVESPHANLSAIPADQCR